MNSNPASVQPTLSQPLTEPKHGDYSYIMKSLATAVCEKFGDISTNYNDPMVELIILMILLVIGVIVIVNYLY